MSLAIPEMTTVFGKQGVTDYKIIVIKKDGDEIQTNTYILTFSKPKIPKEVRIGFCLEKMEQDIPASMSCFKCLKHDHHSETCGGRQTCGRCDEKDPDQTEEDGLNETKCPNRRQSHPTFLKSRDIYKREIGNTRGEEQKICDFFKLEGQQGPVSERTLTLLLPAG